MCERGDDLFSFRRKPGRSPTLFFSLPERYNPDAGSGACWVTTRESHGYFQERRENEIKRIIADLFSRKTKYSKKQTHKKRDPLLFDFPSRQSDKTIFLFSHKIKGTI
jgi:hypothetical protein